MHRTTIYREPGHFAGWPANYGLWTWGAEILVIYIVGRTGPLRGVHARDTSRLFQPVQSRTLDGGATWAHEPFTGHLPGSGTLSADEHVDAPLKALPKLRDEDFAPLTEPIDFTDPESTVLCARTGLEKESISWFYVSRDRGRSWSAPHRLPMFGLSGVSARTDIVPLGRRSALFMLTGTKTDHTEGRVFAARSDDGGATFTRSGYVGPEPAGWSIMPSSLRLHDGTVLAAVRCAAPDGGGGRAAHWIDLYASSDEGRTWSHRARPVPDTGYGGNPPALIRLPDGTIAIVYGYRDQPCGIRMVSSADAGRTWAGPRVITDDTPAHDMGYPRAAVLGSGEILTVYYSNSGPESERFIDSVRWHA